MNDREGMYGIGWGEGEPQCTGWGCNVLKRRLGKYKGPWPACWGLEGRCAGGAAGERTHHWGYAHQPSWPGASEAEWGAESAPLAVAKPSFRGQRPVKAQRDEKKYLKTIWAVQWLGFSSGESQMVEKGQYTSVSIMWKLELDLWSLIWEDDWLLFSGDRGYQNSH